MVESYREQFLNEQDAQRYEAQQYGERSYSQLLWTLERRFLNRIISAMHVKPRDYLDFACGTGRILSFVEPYVGSATGMDVSQSMLALARAKTTTAFFVCDDITKPQTSHGRYDLITAFRFLLNAEHELRRNVLRELARRLRDRNSRLIFNNHGNPLSHKIFTWPYHTLQHRLYGAYRPICNYLTHREVTRMIDEAGLQLVEVIGYGHWSSKALHIWDFETVLQMEERLAGRPIAGKFGAHQIYVTRLH